MVAGKWSAPGLAPRAGLYEGLGNRRPSFGHSKSVFATYPVFVGACCPAPARARDAFPRDASLIASWPLDAPGARLEPFGASNAFMIDVPRIMCGTPRGRGQAPRRILQLSNLPKAALESKRPSPLQFPRLSSCADPRERDVPTQAPSLLRTHSSRPPPLMTEDNVSDMRLASETGMERTVPIHSKRTLIQLPAGRGHHHLQWGV